MKVCLYSYFQCCGYFWGPWVSFLLTDEFWVRITIITSRTGVSRTHSLSFCFQSIFNSMNLFLTHSNFVECKSFLESSSLDILVLCETNLDGSIDSGNFSVRGYLPLNQKGSTTHMHDLAVYLKERLPFAQDLSLENSADSYLCFWLDLLHSVSYFFFLYQLPSLSLCTAFYSISSNIDEVLLIKPSANVFVFGGFDAHHKDWLTYSGGTDRTSELCYNFSISNDLTQIVSYSDPWLWLS